MPPEEQDRFMENNERFKNLPPERQQQIRQNLQKWNNLTPEQQAAVTPARGRARTDDARATPVFHNDSASEVAGDAADRRQAINRHLAMLSKMRPETQQAALNDPRFLQGLSPDEQSMLRDLNSLRNPHYTLTAKIPPRTHRMTIGRQSPHRTVRY